jgi:hypothetical protein
MCLSILQIGSLVFSPFFRSGEICFSLCCWPWLAAEASSFSRTRMLVRRWWIYCSSPTLSIGGERSWSKTARGRLPIDVPQRYVPCCMCGPVNRLTKPRWRWCFLGSGSGGGLAFLPACVWAALELAGGR